MLKSLLKKYRATPVQIKASLWFLVCSFFQKGISIISTPIFTRLLTTSEYGQFNIFNSWLGICTIFVCLTLYNGVYTQGLVKYSENSKEYSSSLQFLHFLFVLSWTIVYAFTYSFWNELFQLTTTQILLMLLLIWTTGVFNFWASEQRVLYKYKELVILTIVISLLKPIVGVVLVSCFQDKVTARILGLAVVELIGYISLFFRQIISGKVLCNIKFWLHAIRFNIPLVPHYLSQIILSSADRIMIGDMVSDTAAGIYSLAYSLSLIMLLFNTAISQTLNPWIYQKIKARNIDDISSVAYFSILIVAFVNILLIAFAPELVALFAPKEYYEAIWIIPPVAMSALFMYCYDLFAKFAFYFEKTKFIMFASVFGAILNILLNYLCIPVMGYMVAGYTTLVCYIIYVLGHCFFMNKVCDTYLEGKRPYNYRIIISIMLSFLGIGFGLMCSYYMKIIRFLFVFLIVFFVYLFRKSIISNLKKLLNTKGNRE